MLKRVLKIAGGLLGLLLVAVLGSWLYIELTWQKDLSNVTKPRIAASRDPEVIARGKYLVEVVAHCSGCHEPPDAIKARKLVENLSGGFAFEAGPFGNFFAANLSSDPETGIGKLDDATLARALRYGVGRDGRKLTFMSFVVGPMADQDLLAVVSYLRTLPPVRNPVPPDEPGVIAKLILKRMQQPSESLPAWVPPGGVSLERGRYLANGPAACRGCHSEYDALAGFAFKGPAFAGNPEAEPDDSDPAYEIVAPNLTSDPETGQIARWSEETFVARFRAGRLVGGSHMPWENFGKLTEEDVRSLYRYLRSVPAVKKRIGPTRRLAGTKPT